MGLLDEKERKISRFLNSDQFTIYLPLNFDKIHVSTLCMKIDQLIQNKHITSSGNISDVAAPITQIINIRQEYLTGDKERIDAVPTASCDKVKRIQVKKEIETSSFYKQLHSLFNIRKKMSTAASKFAFWKRKSPPNSPRLQSMTKEEIPTNSDCLEPAGVCSNSGTTASVSPLSKGKIPNPTLHSLYSISNNPKKSSGGNSPQTHSPELKKTKINNSPLQLKPL